MHARISTHCFTPHTHTLTLHSHKTHTHTHTHTTDTELVRLAETTEGYSCRDIKEVCENTERKWASKVIRKEVKEGTAPTLREYMCAAKVRGMAQVPMRYHSV